MVSRSFFESISPQLEMTAGQHRITAKAWDVNGQSYSKTIYITVSSAQSCTASTVGVKICAPTNNATVVSPVEIIAAAKGTSQIRAWVVYVDGKNVWSPDLFSTTIAPKLDMTVGQHRITAKAWDIHGNIYSKTIYIFVAP
jgi:Bacterial Ig domain